MFRISLQRNKDCESHIYFLLDHYQRVTLTIEGTDLLALNVNYLNVKAVTARVPLALSLVSLEA